MFSGKGFYFLVGKYELACRVNELIYLDENVDRTFKICVKDSQNSKNTPLKIIGI